MTKPEKSQTPQAPRRRHTIVRVLAAALAVLIAIGGGLFLWYKNSPYLTAMLIRKNFEDGGHATNNILERYAPRYIPTVRDISYRDDDKDALLDIYYTPKDYATAPTIVWIHGGGWLAGNKDDLSPWARILSDRGFNVVALNYSLAPEHHYPLPIIQTNAALRYINDHADEVHIDPKALILAGDSAGAQLAAQAALIETNTEYSRLIGIKPALTKGRIAAMLLNCGPYNLSLADSTGGSEGEKIVQAFLWAYTGKKDFMNDSDIRYASIPQYVTKDFPPSFITAGNADPLLSHSTDLASTLRAAGVEVDALFYPSDHTPQLGHEYQFDLDTKEAKEALNRMVDFSERHAR